MAVHQNTRGQNVDHDDLRGIPITQPTQRRLRDHADRYQKPFPVNWWDWHCQVCGGPITDMPR
jgi:hypothetical protein